MNTETAKLLEQLAQKMGTTSEYLWGVLIKQAPIDATISLIQIIMTLLFGMFLYRIHKRFLKKPTEDSHYDHYYEKYDIALALPMIGAGLVFAFLLIAGILSINCIISGYFNPEYWALDRVLHFISQ